MYSILVVSLFSFGLWFYYGKGGVRDANLVRDTYNQQKLDIAARELHKAELSKYFTAIQSGDDAALELAARRYGLVGEREYLWKVIPMPVEPVASN